VSSRSRWPVLFAVFGLAPAAAQLAYPPSPRGAVVDEYHGTMVADPWRWLEDTASPATAAWIERQNDLTAQETGRMAGRSEFGRLIADFLEVQRYGVPQQGGPALVYRYNGGHDQQDSLWTSRVGESAGRVLVDAASLSVDGTVSIADFSLSPDGRYIAYALSDGGSDWKLWRLREVASGRDLPERLPGTKFTSVAWRPDSKGFYYSRYPLHADAARGYDDTRPVAVWFHAPGTAHDQDRLVYERGNIDRRDPYAEVTADGRYLVVTLSEGYETNGVMIGHLAGSPADAVKLEPFLTDFDARHEFLGLRRGEFFFRTTHSAPTGRIVAVRRGATDSRAWREVVPAAPEPIEAAVMAGGRLIVSYVVDIRTVLRTYNSEGRAGPGLGLPGAGTVSELGAAPGSKTAYFSYTDFATAGVVYALSAGEVEPRAWRTARPRTAVPPLSVQRADFRSRDGTVVPMTLVRRADIGRDAPAPTVLYGYGGFNISLLPAYSATRLAWIAAGGTYAVANLRGGGEFGESWHQAGTRLAKQNVFDDFIAAAESLIRAAVTDRDSLAIWGASNGGLLVGAVLNQRPDLFAAAVPAVGVMDMLRYHLPSANARQWSSDFGIAENPAEFRALRSYSPYHNVLQGACYPPVLVTADAQDDRVAPWHSYKYAAAMQSAQACPNAVLIRIETRAGHGARASRSKIIAAYADQWAFVAAATGLPVGQAGGSRRTH